tara:strand:- start:29134 stop:29964 length:831 start_codon:yes stop_codon:yes gene_type:complete
MGKIVSNKFQNLTDVSQEFKGAYANAMPFPNIYFDAFFDETILSAVLDEFPDLAEGKSLQYKSSKEKKFAGKGEELFGEKTKKLMHFLNSQPFLEFLQELTGIEETLIPDPFYAGGGLHEIKQGGLLKVHADFNKHRKTGLDRRLNVLVYLNKDWQENFGGHFELWNKEMTQCENKILPLFNRMAIFSTTSTSYHGHPDALNCPEDRSRKSLALYYYTNGRPHDEIDQKLVDHGTLFKDRPSDDEEPSVKPIKNKWKILLKDFAPPILIRVIKKYL